MERGLSYLLGGIVTALVLGAILMLFGGAFVGILSAILAFPLAAPLTTSAVLITLFGAVVLFWWRRR